MFERLEGRWIVAVSGHSDSMALLSMCIEKEMDIVACIIHYHVRSEADQEVAYVTSFCHDIGVNLVVIDAPLLTSNFQQQARTFRYRQFAELVEKYDALGVLTAHHQDDMIETYLWQKNRDHRVNHYGIKETAMIEGVLVHRPLLHVSKKDILYYNEQHDIRYFEDTTNTDMKYERNRIRRMLDDVDEKTKAEILKECQQRQNLLQDQRMRLEKLLDDTLDIDALLALEQSDQLELVWMFLIQNDYPHSVSKNMIIELIRQLKQNKTGWIPLKDDLAWYYQSNRLGLITKKDCQYRYTFDTIKDVKTPFFTILSESDQDMGVHVKEDDFPITIRNFEPGDKMHVKVGHRKLKSWFNQEKIPWHQRSCWPVVLNRKDEIIYVVGWGCDINHSTNNPNLFVLK